MRWTPERIEELRSLAYLGSVGLGAHFGVARTAVQKRAEKSGIHLGPRRVTMPPDERLRARWAEMLPGMRERVRDAVLAS